MSDETRSIEEAIAGVLHRHDAVSGAWWTEEQVASLQAALVEAIDRAAWPATPAAGEDVRQRVRQAVEWGIEDAWPRYNRIYDPHDPDDESRQEWVDCITEQVVTALLRTPSGEGEVIHIPLAAEYRDDGSVHWRVRLPVGAASGEGEAQKVEAVLRRWNRVAGDVEGSDGPLTDTEIAAISRDVATALRSEAPGEVWREVDDLLARLERFEYDAAGESEEYWRVVTIRDRIAAARRGEGGGE